MDTTRRRWSGERVRYAGAALALAAIIGFAPVAPARALNYTWNGEGGDANWSNPANWVGGAGPVSGESSASLTFPALSGPYETNNDLTGLVVTFLEVDSQAGGGDYAFAGNSITLAGPVTLGGHLDWQIPLALQASVTLGVMPGGGTKLAGDIDLDTHTLTFNALGETAITGVVSGAGNLVKNNTAVLTLAKANTYSGTTTIGNGSIVLADAAALGTAGAGTTITGGVLGFAPGSAFTLGEPLTFTGGGILAAGTPTIAGPVTFNAAVEVRAVDQPAVLTIGSAVGGTGGLTKKGLGRLVLTGASTYAGGTAVVAGALRLDGSLASAADVRVQSGGTLNGSGSTAGAIVVDSGGTLAPGTSPGRLACGGLTLAAGATFAVEIAGPAAGSDYDQLAVDGPVRLDGTLAVAFTAPPVNGQQFTLIDQSGGAAVMGTFAGRPQGSTFEVNGTLLGVTYTGGSGNDVALITNPGSPTATPTPTATTSSGVATATATPGSPTPTVDEGTPTPTGTPTFTPTPTVGVCTGDCNGDGTVAINELIIGVNIALGTADISECPAFDADGSGTVAIQELIAAVNAALDGCF